jgi:hypothetical protein
MRLSILIILVIFGIHEGNSQTSSYWLLKGVPKDTRQLFHVSADASWASNSLNNEWLSEMVIGGEIGNVQKNSLYRSMSEYNRIGGNIAGDIQVYSFIDSVFGSQQWGLTAGVSRVSVANLYFNRDLFDLTFFGNARSQGDTMELGKMYGQIQTFQKLGIGIFNKENLSAVRLSYVSGIDYANMKVDRADWYTAPNTSITTLDYDMTYEMADTTKSGAFTARGQGFCIDADLNIPMKMDGGFFAISVRNIGYTYWRNSIEYSGDSTFVWNGLEVNEILDVDAESVRLPQWQDTLGLKSERVSKWRALPGSIHFRMLKKLNNKSSYEAGILLQPNYAALPLVSLGYNHFVGRGLLLSERVSFGGYGRLAVGVEMQYLIADKVFIRLGTQHLWGVVSSQSRGANLFTGISLVL